jgi:hypothetical protein
MPYKLIERIVKHRVKQVEAEYARNVELIRQSMKDIDEGRGIPMEVVFARVRKVLGIPDGH